MTRHVAFDWVIDSGGLLSCTVRFSFKLTIMETWYLINCVKIKRFNATLHNSLGDLWPGRVVVHSHQLSFGSDISVQLERIHDRNFDSYILHKALTRSR